MLICLCWCAPSSLPSADQNAMQLHIDWCVGFSSFYVKLSLCFFFFLHILQMKINISNLKIFFKSSVVLMHFLHIHAKHWLVLQCCE